MNAEKFPSFKSRVESTHLSKRDILDYVNALEISLEDLNDPEAIILDLGSGLEQNLAKEMREDSFRSKIVSLDPRFGLSVEEDIALIKSENPVDDEVIEKRKKNRKEPESLTLAALSQNLPFKDNSFHHVYALYSVPYYLTNNVQEIKRTLEEVIRVVKPGGSVRAFPVIKDEQGLDQVTIVEKILEEIKNVHFAFVPKEKLLGDENWLLIIKKDREDKKNF